jgi:hypothetical protein
MEQLVTLHYQDLLPPNVVRFGEALLDGRLVGARCPVCSRVYVPNRGLCSLDVVTLGEEHELEVSDKGVVASFTIVTPVRYYGQTKTEPFIFASVLLDGTASPLRGQDVTGIPMDKVRAGLRVQAVWKPLAERTSEGLIARATGSSVEGSIASFAATGEPNLGPESYRGYEF